MSEHMDQPQTKHACGQVILILDSIFIITVVIVFTVLSYACT